MAPVARLCGGLGLGSCRCDESRTHCFLGGEYGECRLRPYRGYDDKRLLNRTTVNAMARYPRPTRKAVRNYGDNEECRWP